MSLPLPLSQSHASAIYFSALRMESSHLKYYNRFRFRLRIRKIMTMTIINQMVK